MILHNNYQDAQTEGNRIELFQAVSTKCLLNCVEAKKY